MPTKYYQNNSKGIKVIERTSFCLHTDGHRAVLYICYIPRTLSVEDKKLSEVPEYAEMRHDESLKHKNDVTRRP